MLVIIKDQEKIGKAKEIAKEYKHFISFKENEKAFLIYDCFTWNFFINDLFKENIENETITIFNK